MPRGRRVIPVIAAALLALTSGCGLLSGGDSSGAAARGPLEKSKIKVGSLGIVDSAPLHLAIDNGYFAAEGLEVDLSVGSKGSANIDGLLGGSVDFGLSSYPPAITPHVKGVANFKIVADAVQTSPNLILVVVRKNSPIKTPQDLAGKKIAVSSKRGISELALNSRLKTMSIDHTKVQYISMDIRDMANTLERGGVDAATITEPHLTQALKTVAVPLMDPFTGPTGNFPWSGWLVNKKFAEENPKTVAAFQRALSKGIADTADKSKVEKVLVKHLKIEEPTAQIMTLPVFPSSTDPARLQRVADLMFEFGEIPKRLDIREMLLDDRSAK